MSCFKERLNTASSWTHRWAAVGQLHEVMYALAKLYKITGPLNDFEDSATTRKEVPRRRHGPVFTWIILRTYDVPRRNIWKRWPKVRPSRSKSNRYASCDRCRCWSARPQEDGASWRSGEAHLHGRQPCPPFWIYHRRGEVIGA